jgi:hypothetical protein
MILAIAPIVVPKVDVVLTTKFEVLKEVNVAAVLKI